MSATTLLPPSSILPLANSHYAYASSSTSSSSSLLSKSNPDQDYASPSSDDHDEIQFLVRFQNRTHLLSFANNTIVVKSINEHSILDVLSKKINIPAMYLRLVSPLPSQFSNNNSSSSSTRSSTAIHNNHTTPSFPPSPSSCKYYSKVYFLTATLNLHLRGGKGGFGTLLKGQSKQAGAKTTLDFGACRDLSGRRLRHVNDEIKLRKWREMQKLDQKYSNSNKEWRTEKEMEIGRTKSGISNWHLSVPSWADVSMSDKRRRETERGVRREVERRLDGEEEERRRVSEEKERRERVVAEYANVGGVVSAGGDMDGGGNAMEDAIKIGMQKMDKKRKREENGGVTHAAAAAAASSVVLPLNDTATTATGVPIANANSSWFCSLSGDIITLDDDTTTTSHDDNDDDKLLDKMTIQAGSDFSTGCVLLPPPKYTSGFTSNKWYYEVIIQTAGLCQLGWASEEFVPNSSTGDGVGDDKLSFAYDGSRALKFHADGSKPYGNAAAWKKGDVVGCLLDANDGTISFSMNGTHLGVAFTLGKNSTFGLIPALSLNGGEVVNVSIGPSFAFLPQGYKGVHQAMQDQIDPANNNNQPSKNISTPSVSEMKPQSILIPPKIHDEPSPSTTTTTTTTTQIEKKVPTTTITPTIPKELDLTTIESMEELEQLGMERLKSALMALGVKCGGSLKERAIRLFSLKGLERKDYPSKVRAKNFIP